MLSKSNVHARELEKSSRSLKCFALAIVNTILIAGVIVVAARGSNNDAGSKITTNNSISTVASTPSMAASKYTVTADNSRVSFVELQALPMDQKDLPAHIWEAIGMLDSYLRKTVNISDENPKKCRFAWNMNSVTNKTDLFECR